MQLILCMQSRLDLLKPQIVCACARYNYWHTINWHSEYTPSVLRVPLSRNLPSLHWKPRATMTKLIVILLLATLSTKEAFGTPIVLVNPFKIIPPFLNPLNPIAKLGRVKGEVTRDLLKGFGKGFIFGKRSADDGANYHSNTLPTGVDDCSKFLLCKHAQETSFAKMFNIALHQTHLNPNYSAMWVYNANNWKMIQASVLPWECTMYWIGLMEKILGKASLKGNLIELHV